MTAAGQCMFCRRYSSDRMNLCWRCFDLILDNLNIKKHHRGILMKIKKERDEKGCFNCRNCDLWLITSFHHYFCNVCWDLKERRNIWPSKPLGVVDKYEDDTKM